MNLKPLIEDTNPIFAGLTLSDMTPGSIIFAGIGGVLSQDNSNLFWDDTNKRLGIGTNSPGRHLHLRKANPVFRFDDSSGTTVTNSVGFIEFGSYNPFWDRHGWIGYGSSIDDALTINNEDGSNIALMGGNVGIGTKAPETLSEWEGTAPYLTIHNSAHEDTDGGGESRLIYKREDGAGTETACFQFEASHDGPGVNDQLGKGVWSVNTGAGLVQALEIGSDLLATFGGAVSIPTSDLTVNTNTLFVDASENAVGIGLTNPQTNEFECNKVGRFTSAGGVVINKELSVNTIDINKPFDNHHKFTSRGDGALVLQSQSDGFVCELDLMTAEGDNTDNVMLIFYAEGLPGDTDTSSQLRIQYKSSDNTYNIWSHESGTGTVWPIHIYTNGNPEQIVAQPDGDVMMDTLPTGNTQAVSGAAAGELWVTDGHATQEDNTVMMGV